MERRRFPRRRIDGVQAYIYVPGESTQRCKIRSLSKAGLFIEIEPILPRGLAIELAFTRLYTHQVIKLYRRSAYITRVTDDGVAALFLAKHAAVA
jgi:hypothetical protein